MQDDYKTQYEKTYALQIFLPLLVLPVLDAFFSIQ
jgi:hypothetical protein